MTRRVLVAGIGNIFLSDDGFGVEVVRRLAGQPVPEGVRVADYGIRGVHLAYDLLAGYDALVLVDAVPMGAEPGTLAVIEPDTGAEATEGAGLVDAHDMNPRVVLDMVTAFGGVIGTVRIVGCQPATLDENIGLSEPVEAAVDGAVALCHEVLADMFTGPLAGADLADLGSHPT